MSPALVLYCAAEEGADARLAACLTEAGRSGLLPVRGGERMLTERQRRFAEEYLVDLNRLRAYRVAYSSCKSDIAAKTHASRILKSPEVAAYIRERREERREELRVQEDEILRELAAIAFSPLGTPGIRLRDKLRALELLGKHLGMFEVKKDALDIEEQQAQIALLHAQTEAAKAILPDAEDRELRVVFVNRREAEK